MKTSSMIEREMRRSGGRVKIISVPAISTAIVFLGLISGMNADEILAKLKLA